MIIQMDRNMYQTQNNEQIGLLLGICCVGGQIIIPHWGSSLHTDSEWKMAGSLLNYRPCILGEGRAMRPACSYEKLVLPIRLHGIMTVKIDMLFWHRFALICFFFTQSKLDPT
jgi:hypothetical protein